MISTLASCNPSTNHIIDHINISTTAEITEKVTRAHLAKKAWKNVGIQKRVDLLRTLQLVLKKHIPELAALTTAEMGKTVSDTNEDFIWDFDYYDSFLQDGPAYIQDEITVKENGTLHRIVYEPRGVVACIVPWNFPFANFVWSVIPNLLVGNTVIFKHSEECPLISKKIEDIVNEYGQLPEGVFSVVHGGADVGLALAKQDIDMIWFTGSSNVGKQLAELAGQKQIKAVLEMGGSNPAVVLPDADLNLAVPRLYRGRFTNCGQVCDAIKRVIVHESLHDKLAQQLTDYIATIQVGDPLLASTQIGPLAAMRQVDLLEAQVNDAIQQGATVLIGGKRPANLSGAFYLPTLLTNINTNMRVWREEVFGPVLVIKSYQTEEEAIQLANNTIYGLGAHVFSADLSTARRIAGEIDAGFVDINEGNHWRACNPFGGFKASGMGCEHGKLGFQELCRFKVIAES